MSRSKKYENGFLLGVIYEYMEKKKGKYRKIVLQDVVKFAQEELKEQDIRYYDFGRNPEVKAEIDKINNALYSPNRFYRYEYRNNLDINIDAMVERCVGNELLLSQELTALLKRASAMADELTDLSMQNKRIVEDNCIMKKKNEELEHTVKNLTKDNTKLYGAISDERQKQLRSVLVAYQTIRGEGDEEEFERSLNERNGADMAEVINFFKRRD